VRSAAVPARGGLAWALARSAIAGDLGLDLDLSAAPDLEALPADDAIFSESCGRFVVTTAESDAASFEKRFRGLACRRVGRVTEEKRLVARLGGRSALVVAVADLRDAF
jgi:phosphoribosylformylglycinamidine synthase